MYKHLITVSKEEAESLISGELKYLVRFFRKKFEFLNQLDLGDLVYLKKGKEIFGQFNVEKIIKIEGLRVEDWAIVGQFAADGPKVISKEIFEKKLKENSIVIVIQREKFEQFITSPIDAPKSRKEWVVLE